ncbi:MAG TPA: SURF1 family protein [Dermatophilaceae bacterium]|nr:SURF1 family protein [Dermatophilaceae bacterium]
MIRLLLTRRWLAALALALGFFLTCVYLGRWQWARYEGAASRAGAVETNYQAPPQSLDGVPQPGATLTEERVWTRVQVAGQYDPAAQLMVRNRPQDVVYGFEVLVPLLLPDGTGLLVNRGWIKNAERADVLPAPPPAPSGPVTVTGWLRPGEPDLERDLPAGQLASIDLSEASRQIGRPLRGAYLLLDREEVPDGSTPARPQPLRPPETGTGPHLAYAFQWWLASLVGFVLVGVSARREWRESAAAPQGSDLRPRPAPRPRKVRIWDEEDE